MAVVEQLVAVDRRQARDEAGLAGRGEGEVSVGRVEGAEGVEQVVRVETRCLNGFLLADHVDLRLDGLGGVGLVAGGGLEGDVIVVDEHAQRGVAFRDERDAFHGGQQVGGGNPHGDGSDDVHQVPHLREGLVQQAGGGFTAALRALTREPDQSLTLGLGGGQRHGDGLAGGQRLGRVRQHPARHQHRALDVR